MKLMALFFSTAALAVLGGGCTTHGPYEPLNTTKYTLEDKAKFILLDKDMRDAVTCTGLQEGRTTDGRMKIAANLHNQGNKRIEVQADCVFKDAQGFALDEQLYRTIILDENATETATFEAINTNAVKYTVRVRSAR